MGNVLFNNLRTIKIANIRPNPEQPRKYFDDTSIEELAISIKRCGIINPISVKKVSGYYEIIAGERRYRAAKMAGLIEVPCIVITDTGEKAVLISVVENIQRWDLNFVEEALSYQKLITEFSFKQEEVASKIGKSQSAVANKIRILKLGEEMLGLILEHGLTERHARALLKISEEQRMDILQYIIKKNLNVAKTDEYIEKILNPPPIKQSKYFKLKADVRFFINSVNKSIDLMKTAGINATINKTTEEGELVYTIRIPT